MIICNPGFVIFVRIHNISSKKLSTTNVSELGYLFLDFQDWWIFSKYFPNYEKLKSFVETFTPNNQIPIFREPLCMSNTDI